MRCDVDLTGGGTVLAELVLTRLGADKDSGIGQQRSQCIRFVVDMRREFIGDGQDEVLTLHGRRLALAADFQNRRAGAVGHIVHVDDISFTIEQGMKRDVMQDLMRNDNQSLMIPNQILDRTE